jgi:hypothetical protein
MKKLINIQRHFCITKKGLEIQWQMQFSNNSDLTNSHSNIESIYEKIGDD